MKARRIAVLGVGCCVVVGAAAGLGLLDPVVSQLGKSPGAAIEDSNDRASYALGVMLAKSATKMPNELRPEYIERGLRDALSGGQLSMSDDELKKTLLELRSGATLKQSKLAQDNAAAGQAFLSENGKKEGVVSRPSGLQYKVLKAGTGATPTDTDTVEVNFRGTLVNGTEFDSSFKAGKPSTLPVRRLISGWREALKLMPVGSHWQLVVPPQLAYGKAGMREKVGPNETLVFDVELLSITPEAQAATGSTQTDAKVVSAGTAEKKAVSK